MWTYPSNILFSCSCPCIRASKMPRGHKRVKTTGTSEAVTRHSPWRVTFPIGEDRLPTSIFSGVNSLLNFGGETSRNKFAPPQKKTHQKLAQPSNPTGEAHVKTSWINVWRYVFLSYTFGFTHGSIPSIQRWSLSMRSFWRTPLYLPSRELTYPTLGKGKSSPSIPWEKGMLVLWKVKVKFKKNWRKRLFCCLTWSDNQMLQVWRIFSQKFWFRGSQSSSDCSNPTRWAPTSYKWSDNSYKWPYLNG